MTVPHVSLSWLRDHVDVPEGTTTEQLGEALTRVGLEEEEVHPAAVSGPLVAGRVLSYEVEKHSNGKSIRYARVDVGDHNDEPGSGAEPSEVPSRGIVCGAHNFEVGDTVAVVLPGATLPGPFPISARKTYGHVSDGMICSVRELGIGTDHDGILVLEGEDVPAPGEDLANYLGLGEEVLEVNVTPDRGYCFSVRGLAREYAHATGGAFRDLGVPEALETGLPPSDPEDPATEGTFSVVIEGEEDGVPAADRFVTRIVRGLDPQAKSPKWMVQRLEQAGMRPISLPVDVTNYVMLDLGQPLHAYDMRAVAEPFVVRRAKEGEPFTTLDGVERVLDSGDIVISDSPDGEGSRLVGLAGVMGGMDSEVQPDTTDVVIEAAHFDPKSIARTSHRHNLSSESSKRFERGVDPNLAPVAATRVAELLAEYGGGKMDEAAYDLNLVADVKPVKMAVSEPARLTGVDYSPTRIVELLEEVGCKVEVPADNADDGYLLVTPPSWRPDLVGPAHLVEEIARLDGYDNIPTRLPVGKGSTGLSKRALTRRIASMTLAQNGLVEVKSYPFVGDTWDKQIIPEGDQRRKAAKLANPLADDAPYMRTSLLDSLLATAERNASRGVAPLALFEVGQVTLPEGTVPSEIFGVESRPTGDQVKALLRGVPRQPWHVAGVMGGKASPASGEQLLAGQGAEDTWGWSDAIEAVHEIASAAGVRLEATRTWVPEGTKKLRGAPLPQPVANPEDAAPFHPGRSATLFVRAGRGLKVLGRAGELHPRVVAEFGLPQRSAAFEIDMDTLASLISDKFVKAKPVSTYPPVKEDIAVIVEDYIPQSDVESTIKRASRGLLEDLTLFDVYRGDQIPDGSRSLAYSLVFRAPDHTLDAKEVEETRKRIISDLEKRLKATVRAG